MALAEVYCSWAVAYMMCCCEHCVVALGTRFRMPGLRFSTVLGTRRLAVIAGADSVRRLLKASAVFTAEESLDGRTLPAVTPEENSMAFLEDAAERSTPLPPAAHSLLLKQTVDDNHCANLVGLESSVAPPDLKARIVELVAGTLRK